MKPNNPDGKKGGKKHQELQNEILEKLKKEVQIPVYKGDIVNRIVDVAAFVMNRIGNTVEFIWLRIVQIGKTDKHGKPVKREKEAIADIEEATGIKAEFYDYNTKKKID